MKVIEARNVHQALVKGIYELQRFGSRRDSRNGPVLLMSTPVTTVYEKPEERVVFWPGRDANPFFHLYESLWMLAGHQQVQPLLRYAKNMANYADDGVIHGAYGRRWKFEFGMDQLKIIADRLRESPNDRRSVLQMWDARLDLDKRFKDVPCNVMATFQIDMLGRLDLTVFCRSNDIIWGAYGANAVHFSMLQEYMARSIGVPIGRYYQISVNWHAYVDVLQKLIVATEEMRYTYATAGTINDPYLHGVKPTLLPQLPQDELNRMITTLMFVAEQGFNRKPEYDNDWYQITYNVLQAHQVYKARGPIAALNILTFERFDWAVAAREWLERRVKNGVGTTAKSELTSETEKGN